MRRLLIACTLALAPTPWAGAQDPLPAKVLTDLKAATVFVKVQTGRGAATGTGFVIRAEDDTALVVTNEHVVTPPRQYGPVTRIDVVFHSGRGKAERVVRAELLAADASRDLAFLRVRGVKGVAAPIDLGRKAEVTETSTVYALGFPFGTALSTTRGNPAVTVGKGTVSSLREDEAGEVAVVQIDGDINPGNSGGPVVDGQGRLVGIAVAKITGTRIGLAIPPSELTKMLDGRLGSLTTRVAKSEPGASEVEVVMGLIDPLGKVTRASVRLLPKAPGQPDPSGRPRDRRPIPGAEEVVLKVDPAAQRATGTVTLKGPADKGLTEYWLQPVYTNGARADIAAGAVTLRVDFSGKAVAARQPPTPQPPPPGPGSAPRNRPGIDPPAAAPAGPPPEPKAAGVTAAPFESGDLKGTRLTAGTGAAPGCACWTADGRGFYHLDGQGTVRRISYPGLREEAALAVGRGCNWLSLSAVGLVATVPQAQEAWVLDPVTLKVGTRIPIAGAQRVVSAPQHSHGFAPGGGLGRPEVVVYDLKAGKPLRTVALRSPNPRLIAGFDRPTFSPDGRYAFAVGLETVVRLKVNGPDVAVDEVGPRLIQGAFVGLSVGSQHVAAPSGGGNYGITPDATSYSTYVFAHGDLKTPVVTLKSGPYPSAVGFDPAAGLFYAQNSDKQLIVFDKAGNKLKEYALTDRLGGVQQFLVHPAGGKLLVLAGNHVFALDVPKP